MILEAETFQSESHVIAIIQNFTLVNLTFTATPHSTKLLFGAVVFFHLMHLTTYSTPYCLYSWKVFLAVETNVDPSNLKHLLI